MVLDTKAEASIVCIIELDLEHLIPKGKVKGVDVTVLCVTKLFPMNLSKRLYWLVDRRNRVKKTG